MRVNNNPRHHWQQQTELNRKGINDYWPFHNVTNSGRKKMYKLERNCAYRGMERKSGGHVGWATIIAKTNQRFQSRNLLSLWWLLANSCRYHKWPIITETAKITTQIVPSEKRRRMKIKSEEEERKRNNGQCLPQLSSTILHLHILGNPSESMFPL